MFACDGDGMQTSGAGYLGGVGLAPATVVAMLAALLASIALGACSGADSGSGTADSTGSGAAQGPAEPRDEDDSGDSEDEAVAVIERWSETLRGGDERGAAELFATPSLVDNGTGPLSIETTDDALAFNRSLPCGAVLLGTEARGELTIATFRLTERPGSGTCGPGVGSRARTAFEVADGSITVWQRVPTRGDGSTEPAPTDPV
ncbi:hypothetical protein HJD18_07480 [Thermoleophilia bacterium SCSIO 60948]|nr:hypothetical protein HJD18_07480 [Thermoleophilia bacterium SCSIO 60948]